MQKTDFPGSGRLSKKSKSSMSDLSAPRDNDNHGAVEGHDNFDYMPDSVILHILSFMETKDAVRTCVLSKRWRNLWIAIPCLNFNSRSFSRLADFRKFVTWVLSRRDSSCVKALTYNRAGVDYATDQTLFNKVIEHATSHGVEDIRVNLKAKVVGSPPVDIPLSLFNCESLKRLELRACHPSKSTWPLTCIPAENLMHLEHFTLNPATAAFSKSFASLANMFGFSTLTTLNLSRLTLCCAGNYSPNPFQSCVNLKNLHFQEICFKSDLDPKDFVISAPQLNNITLLCNRFRCKLVVVAPQLVNFSYSYFSPCAFLELSTPSVNDLTIEILEPKNQPEEPHQRPGIKTRHGLVYMFREHHDAKLSFSTSVVSCGTAVVLPKKGCPSLSKWRSLNIQVGSTYKIFINYLDKITAYHRRCSQREDFEVVNV